MERPTYILKLRPLPDATDPAGIRRLRRLLKAALRVYGLRCVGCVEVAEGEVTKTEKPHASVNSTRGSPPLSTRTVARGPVAGRK